MKKCKECGEVKELGFFAKDKSKADGFVNQCKQCRNSYSKDRYELKKPEITKKKAEYRAVNRDKACATSSAWSTANPLKRSAAQAAYRARKRGAMGTHTGEDISRLYGLQKGKCACCKVSLANGYHVDHVVPLALGGTNDKDNLQLLCQFCNCSKGPKDPIDFAQQIGRLL